MDLSYFLIRFPILRTEDAPVNACSSRAAGQPESKSAGSPQSQGYQPQDMSQMDITGLFQSDRDSAENG